MTQATYLPVAKQNGMAKAKRGETSKISLQERSAHASLVALQNYLGNRTVQRLLVQRSANAPTELEDDTADRINQLRGSGQLLDSAIQQKMSQALGYDFGSVRVHTSNDANELNEQLNANAFTTGQDIFFRDGAYSPQSSSGQELIAHELTHVVQQGSGAVGGGGSAMQVNAPGDRFEQEADAVSKAVTSTPTAQAVAPTAQRQEMDKDVYTKRLQRATPDDENMIHKAELPKEEQAAAAPSMAESTMQEEKPA